MCSFSRGVIRRQISHCTVLRIALSSVYFLLLCWSSAATRDIRRDTLFSTIQKSTTLTAMREVNHLGPHSVPCLLPPSFSQLLGPRKDRTLSLLGIFRNQASLATRHVKWHSRLTPAASSVSAEARQGHLCAFLTWIAVISTGAIQPEIHGHTPHRQHQQMWTTFTNFHHQNFSPRGTYHFWFRSGLIQKWYMPFGRLEFSKILANPIYLASTVPFASRLLVRICMTLQWRALTIGSQNTRPSPHFHRTYNTKL